MQTTGVKNLIAACFCGSSALIVLIICFSTEYWVTGEYIMMNDLSVEITEVNYGLFTGSIKRGLLSTEKYPIVMTCIFDAGCAFSCKETADERYNEVRDLYNAWKPEEVPDVSCTAEGMTLMSPDSAKFYFSHDAAKYLFLEPFFWVATVLFLSIAVFFNAIAIGFTLWNTIGNPRGIYATTTALNIYYGIAASSTILTILFWGVEYGANSSNNLGLTQTIAYYSSLLAKSAELNYSYFLLILAFVEQSIAIGVLHLRRLDIRKAKRQNFLREQATASGAQTFMN